MQILKGSVVYRLLEKLFRYYNNSFLKKFVSGFVLCCRNSLLGRSIRAIVNRESYFQYSVFYRMLRKLYKPIDRLVMRLSDVLPKWSEKSLIVRLSGFIYDFSKERFFALAFPIFGIGYVTGRLVLNRMMKRDILFMVLTFLIAVVLAIKPEKRKNYFENSLFYKICLLVLE